MKRLATLFLAAGFTVSALVGMGRGASATPFSDVPANHWAYQYIQSLAADGLIEGYPDGKFKGDRPLTRYEMATIVARVIAKLQANGAQYASKADLDKLQKLTDALKDELDELGVRVTNLEDALDALDKRTKFAQSIALHGTINDQVTDRQRNTIPRSVINNAGVGTVTTYYGSAVGAGRTAGIDPFVNAYLTSPDNNSPLEQAGPGNLNRFDDRFNFVYTINENLTVSIPIHIINYNYGGEFDNQVKYSINPDVVVNIAKAGNLTNVYLRNGALDNLKSSRTGLAYRAPDASQQGAAFENSVQPYQKGFEIGGILNGQTEFQFSYSRVDQTLLNTNAGVQDTNGVYGTNNYFFYTNRPQTGYFQNGAPNSPAGALTSDTFSSGGGTLGSVYLRRQAQIGTVYISAYATPAGSSTYNNAGAITSGAVAAPGFYYIQNTNQVVFTSPLPAGVQVTITYVGYTYSNNTQYQRYQANARVNQKFRGLPGAELGVSFNRVFDTNDLVTTGDLTSYLNGINGNAAGNGYGLVSDTVLGIDFQLPLTFVKLGDPTQAPIIFGEASYSKYSADYQNTPTVADSAGVIGLRLKFYQTAATLQFQSVGSNFFSGAPFRYFGNAPQIWANYKGGYVPQFFGFANNLGINQTFDTSINQTLAGRSNTAQNPNLTFINNVYNPFVASGPQYYSAFAPNETGESINVTSPIKLGDVTINGRLLAQHLQELNPNANATSTYGAQYSTAVKAKFDKLDLGATVTLPAFGTKVAVNLLGSIEHLKRDDRTGVTGYVPFNPAIGTVDPTALANAQAVAPNSTVIYYPNYVDMYHTTLLAGGTLPVTRDIVFGARYSTQHYYGANATTLSRNIDERKDLYDLTLTYNVPKTSSSVGFLFRNQQYKDNVLPTFNFSQNREDVNFTIRF